MTIKFAIDTIGWVGSALVILAYALISSQKINSDSKMYQNLNLVGGIFLAVNTFYNGAFPSTLVNLVWIGIATSALFSILKKKMILVK